MDDVKGRLDSILEAVNSTADFSLHRTLSDNVNPGLTVEGLGIIGLPVSIRDVKELISVSRQSPFGFKSETRIDTNVRRTFELHPDQYSLKNPAWQQSMSKILESVEKTFRVHGKVIAGPNKLLIYEPGGKFDKHKDSEKAERMFGTLVV